MQRDAEFLEDSLRQVLEPPTKRIEVALTAARRIDRLRGVAMTLRSADARIAEQFTGSTDVDGIALKAPQSLR